MRYIFGPVPSRRLGRSLGIDVIPPKTCSYDCVYCESGRTTSLIVQRSAFAAPEDVLHDLEDYFRARPNGADVLTFSSAGEPTLYGPLGELIQTIKRRFPGLPLIVLTNGSLLWSPAVRKALLHADRVAPTLSATTEDVFRRIHRPHSSLKISDILEGYRAFRRDFPGQIHLEVMLVKGYNDHPDQWKEIRRLVDMLQPEQVELNTVIRPPADPDICPVSPEEMERALRFFPKDRSRIIGTFKAPCGAEKDEGLARRVVDIVGRRPCTAQEMSSSLAVSLTDVCKAIADLEREKRIIRSSYGGEEYFRLSPTQ